MVFGEIASDSYDKFVLNRRYAIVIGTSDGCGPCGEYKENLVDISLGLPEIDIGVVDLEVGSNSPSIDFKETYQRHRMEVLSKVPITMIYINGEIVRVLEGPQTKSTLEKAVLASTNI